MKSIIERFVCVIFLQLLIITLPLRAFDGSMSKAELYSYLSKAATMGGWMTDGDNDFNDYLDMAENTGMKFAGRAITLWGGENRLDYKFDELKSRIEKIHARLPDIIIEGTTFEILTTSVENVKVPDWVFEAFDKPVQNRNFDYQAMLNENGEWVNHWGDGKSIPDIRRHEFQMWIYYAARRYIDMGFEAIHFGEMGWSNMGHDDRGDDWWSVLTKVREYASEHARRHLVLCNAFDQGGRVVNGDQLLWDFQEYPSRIQEQCDSFMEAKMVVDYHDAIYGKTIAGNNPLGWYTERQPYLVEIDNWGNSGNQGNCNGYPHVWGYDEITWFGKLSENDRNDWATYAVEWLEENDPAGRFEMPGSRINFSALSHRGNLEGTMKEIWDQVHEFVPVTE